MSAPISKKINQFYIILVSIACALLATVYISGHSIASTTSALVEKELPLQDSISKLRFAIFAQKPILYEYYADTDRDTFLKRFVDSKNAIKDGIYMIPRDEQGQSFLTQIQVETTQITHLAEELDKTLNSNDRDWDKARDILVQVSASEKRVTPLIDNFVSLNQKHINDLAELSKSRILLINIMVAIFSIFIVILSLRLGKQVNATINSGS